MNEPAAAPPRSSSTFIRPTLALLAGIGVTVLIVLFGTLVSTLAALRGVDPNHFVPTVGYLATNVIVSALGAMAGGFTTSRITAGRSFYTVFLLAVMLFVSGAIPAFRGTATAGQPTWYPLTVALIAPFGVLIGGALERRRELRWTRRVR